MRLCEATISELSPPSTGWTGVAYSAGYNARCISIARRSVSLALAKGTVSIHVMICLRAPCLLVRRRATLCGRPTILAGYRQLVEGAHVPNHHCGARCHARLLGCPRGRAARVCVRPGLEAPSRVL